MPTLHLYSLSQLHWHLERAAHLSSDPGRRRCSRMRVRGQARCSSTISGAAVFSAEAPREGTRLRNELPRSCGRSQSPSTHAPAGEREKNDTPTPLQNVSSRDGRSIPGIPTVFGPSSRNPRNSPFLQRKQSRSPSRTLPRSQEDLFHLAGRPFCRGRSRRVENGSAGRVKSCPEVQAVGRPAVRARPRN